VAEGAFIYVLENNYLKNERRRKKRINP